MNEVGSNDDHLLIFDNCCGFSPLYSCYLLVVNTPLASCTASKALNLMYSLTSSCFCKSQIVVLATFPTHKQKEIVCVSSTSDLVNAPRTRLPSIESRLVPKSISTR